MLVLVLGGVGGGGHFRYCCKTKNYRANVSFALAAYLIDRNSIVGTWVQV